MLTAAPRALPSPVSAGPPHTRLYCPRNEAPEVSRHRRRPSGRVDFPCGEPNQSSGLRFLTKVKQKIWNPSAVSGDEGGKGPSAEETKTDRAAKVWAWERDLVHVLPQHSLPESWAGKLGVSAPWGTRHVCRRPSRISSKARVTQSRRLQGLRVTTGSSG